MKQDHPIKCDVCLIACDLVSLSATMFAVACPIHGTQTLIEKRKLNGEAKLYPQGGSDAIPDS